MTCKDCIHYEVCEENHQVSNEGTTFDFVTDSAKHCKHFKDKSEYIALPRVGFKCYFL